METPVDILTHRFGKIVDSGSFVSDYTALALSVDEELQEKFLFFPIEELEADGALIEDDRGVLHSGTGPEHCQASPGENPNWLLNHARNALTLYWHLKERERLEEEQRTIEVRRRELLARRPQPGVYTLTTARGGGPTPYVVAVTADRRIIDLNRTGKHADFTDTFDGLENKSAWTFTPIETGLSA